VDGNLKRKIEVSCLGKACFFNKGPNPNVSGIRPPTLESTGLKIPERPGCEMLTVPVGE